jgi:hypothetical protein
MARGKAPGKSERPFNAVQVAAFPPFEWIPLNGAFPHVKGLVGSGEVAALVLTNDFRAGRLVMGMRWILRETDATGMPLEICLVCNPEYWARARIDDRGVDRNPRVVGPQLVGSDRRVAGSGYAYVRRRELDRLYPRPGPGAAVAAVADKEDETGGKRGPKFKGNWPSRVAAEIARLYRDQPELLEQEDIGALAAHMRTVPSLKKVLPKDDKPIRREISLIIKYLL